MAIVALLGVNEQGGIQHFNIPDSLLGVINGADATIGQDGLQISDGAILKALGNKINGSGIVENEDGSITLKSYTESGRYSGQPIASLAINSNGKLITVPYSKNKTQTLTTQTLQENNISGNEGYVTMFNATENGVVESNIYQNNAGLIGINNPNPFNLLDANAGSVNVTQAVDGHGYKLNNNLVVNYDTTNDYLLIGSTVDADVALRRNSTNIGFVTDGGIDLQDNLLTTGAVQFDLATSQTVAEGKLQWNAVDRTLEFGMGGGVVQQIGQELPIPVKHADNSGLTNGYVVYEVGSSGTNKTVRYARADSETTSDTTIGVMTETVTGGAKGLCTTFGLVRDIDTSHLTEGAAVWLSPSTAGATTSTEPTSPDHAIRIGTCIRSHATEGELWVQIETGSHISDLHDVHAPSPSDLDLLYWNDGNSRYEIADYATLGIAATDTAWMLGATNVLTAASDIGSASGNYDINLKRAGTTIATLKSTGLAVPSLTSGRVAKASTSGILADSIIYDNGSTVGIGSASTGDKFYINGGLRADYIKSSELNTTFNYLHRNSANYAVYIQNANASGNLLYISNGSATPSAGTLRFVVKGDGSVGVGTETTSKKLTVNGDIQGTELTLTSLTSGYLPKAGTGGLLSSTALYESGGNFTIGNNTSFGKFEIYNSSPSATNTFRLSTSGGGGLYLGAEDNSANPIWRLGTNSGESLRFAIGGVTTGLYLSSAGSVSIGTTSGSKKFNVSGTGEFTGEVTFGSNAVLATAPTIGNHLTNKTYVDTLFAGTGKWGVDVKTISLSNITLSGTQTVSGYALSIGERVLVAGQSTASQNGVYIVASGAWTRATDSDSDAELRSYVYTVSAGDYSGYKYRNSNTSAITVDTTAVTYVLFDNNTETDPVFVAWRDGNSVTTGTYKSVTVDTYGRVTAGTNPTTLAGYGITDAYTATEGAALETILNSSALTTNYLTKWDGSKFVDSIISDNGSTATIGGELVIGKSKIAAYSSYFTEISSNGTHFYTEPEVLIDPQTGFLGYDLILQRGLGNVIIGSGFTGNLFDNDKLNVTGNIQYTGLLKPSGTAGTNKQVLSTDATNDAFVTLDHSYISDFDTEVNSLADTWWEGVNTATTGAIPKIDATGNLVDSNITEAKLNLDVLTTNRLLYWDGSSLESSAFFISSSDIYGENRAIKMYRDSGGSPEVAVYSTNPTIGGAQGATFGIDSTTGAASLIFKGYGQDGQILPDTTSVGRLQLGISDRKWRDIQANSHIYANGGISETLTLTEGSFERVLKGLYLSGGDTDTRETFFVGTDFNTGSGVFRLQYYNPSDVLSAVEMSFDLTDAGRPIVYDPNDATEAIKHVMFKEDFATMLSETGVSTGNTPTLQEVLDAGSGDTTKQISLNNSPYITRAKFDELTANFGGAQGLESVLQNGAIATNQEINFKDDSASGTGLDTGLVFLDENGSEKGRLSYRNNTNEILLLSDHIVFSGINISLATSGILSLGTNIPSHTDNSAAILGGMNAGEVYRTGDILKIVH